MIIIAGTLRVKPESVEQALAVFRTMAEHSRAEKGCLAYRFFSDPQDPALFFIFEQWLDESALQAHGWSPHMAEFRRQRAPLVAGEVDIKRYDVTEVREA
jgi:quinol monooxygenase YgiN